METSDTSRFKTYVKGLDEILQGGVPKGYNVLVAGGPGTMKSSLSFHMAYNLALQENTMCVYLSLEQSRQNLLEHMAGLGMDIDECKEHLTVIDLGKLRKEIVDILSGESDWLASIVSQIRTYREVIGCEFLIIDSLDALYALTPMDNPRNQLFHFFESIRDLGVSTFLVSEITDQHPSFGRHEVESFLVDGIIHLDMERDGKNVNLYLGVVKMRKTDYQRGYYPLIVDENGFEIVIK